MVEYEELYLYPDGNLSKISRLAPNAIPITKPKLNSDNTINIKPINIEVENKIQLKQKISLLRDKMELFDLFQQDDEVGEGLKEVEKLIGNL